MNDKIFRAAAVQAAPVYMDASASTEKAAALIEEAAGNDAALIAFGEAWIPGYPFWVWLDGAMKNMPRFGEYQASSIELDGPELRRIRDAAAAHGIFVSMGFSERSGGSLYLAQALIDDHGNLVQGRRKLKPTMAERMVYGEGYGNDLLVQDTSLGRVGSLCCWEHLQPLTRYALYSQQEQIHIAAWPSFGLDTNKVHALGHEVNNSISQVYAVEGQCYVIAPTSIIDDATVDYIADSAGEIDPFRPGGGFSMIYGPDGRALNERVPEHEEGIIYADIDLAACQAAKIIADPAGHYSRPDVTRLLWNQRPAPCVEFDNEPINEVTDRSAETQTGSD
jgi:aliphatic nitrilase